MTRRLWAGIVVAGLLLGLGTGPHIAAAARAPAPSVDELIAWLDDPETEWVATTYLQAIPRAALSLLLQPGRVASGPHDRWTAPMLALSKLGEPAIPAITSRALAILRTRDGYMSGGAHALIKVLGSMGPPAVPALLQIAESEMPAVTIDALDEIVRLEPRSNFFGRDLSAWEFWRPADKRLNELQRQLTPLLPRISQVMERGVRQWKPQSAGAQRPAAYLLARWGTGRVRARGVQVLDDLARANGPSSYGLDALRLLHALKAPETAALIRVAAARVPDSDGLKGGSLLTLATALHQLGDPGYTALLDIPLHDARPSDRMDAARFVASTGEIANASLLLPLLDDHTAWNRRTVAEVALESLQRLTMEQLSPDPSAWQAWLDRNRNVSRRSLVAAKLEARIAAFPIVPIWDANRWIGEFGPGDGPLLFPLIDQYLRRPDLNASAIGPKQFRGGGGSGPVGQYGPRIVTLLLEMTHQSIAGAMERLVMCLKAADPEVRIFGALALAAYDLPQAIEQMAKDAANTPESAYRNRASEFLLRLGDRRGIPARLDTLNSDQEAARGFACRDLRVYSQQPLPCDAGATPLEHNAHVAAWRTWWSSNERTFRVRSREAALDLQAFPISHVSFSGRSVR
jgi:hypothetical protein